MTDNNIVDIFATPKRATLSGITNQTSASQPAANPPNPDLIATLEMLLHKAQTGELRTLLSVGLCQDHSIIDGWQMDPTLPNGSYPYAHLGALAALQQDYMQSVIELRRTL